VIGTIGLVLATGHYSIGETFELAASTPSAPTTWAGPVAFLCLGLFLALVGMLLWRRDADEPETI
jgi:hypothetical protein